MADVLIAAMLGDKHIVTANKALIARKGAELEAKAIFCEVMLLAEACVQGKVPVLRIAQYHLPLQPQSIAALLSGTCGYILSEVENDTSTTVAEVLMKAQSLGYAEANPTADIEAFDATAKAKILARAYFGAPTLNTTVDEKIFRIGIAEIPKFAFSFAAAFRHRIQLIGTIEKTASNKIGIVVMPSLVAKNTYLAGLHGVENGIVINELIGPPSRYAGPGAGGQATSAAIMGDLATVANAIATGIAPTVMPLEEVSLASFDEVTIRPVFLSSSPESDKGIFRAKAAVIENAGLSIEQILNDSSGGELGDSFDAIVCQAASINSVLKAKAALEALPIVHGKVSLLRVLGDEPFSFPL
jgi:homoserine dehydrogenase